MSNNFSFSTTANASQSSVKAQFDGNKIYDVKFDGCEAKDFDGKKDPTKKFKTLILKFSNKDAEFTHTIYEPTVNGYQGKSDFERTETFYDDKKTGERKSIPQPSNVESMMLLFKHAIDVINPKVAAEIDSKSKNLGASDWDSLRTLVAKILNEGKGVETKIKLITSNKGIAKFPGFFAAVNSEGTAYIKNNFIGNKVAFTPYEITRIANASATPTDMSKQNSTINLPKVEEEEESLDNVDVDFSVNIE